jgi:hypothetical protein
MPSGIAAPTEQPPRKLSGIKNRVTWTIWREALEIERPPKGKFGRFGDRMKLSGTETDGAVEPNVVRFFRSSNLKDLIS